MKDVKEAKVSPGKPGRREKAGHRESAKAGKSGKAGKSKTSGTSKTEATDYDLGVIYGGFDHIYYRMAEVVNAADVIKRGLATLTPTHRRAIPGEPLADVDRAIERIYEYAKIARNAAYDIQVAIHHKRMGAK